MSCRTETCDAVALPVPGTLCVCPPQSVMAADFVGCGDLDDPASCSGYPDQNNATCVCDWLVPRRCVGDGYHSTLLAPYSYTAGGNKKIMPDPLPCGWRWKCSITTQGSDGESGCLTIPGCQFWSGDDTYKVFSGDMHPNLYEDGLCHP